MHLLLLGLNHAVAGVELREQAVVDAAGLPRALALLQARPELSGAMVLSTCGRTEVYATGGHLGAMTAAVRGCLRRIHPEGYPLYADRLYLKADREAARHLFRVAAGTDSLLVGESQVLGQVRSAVRAARRSGRLDPLLEGTADRAVAAARRARMGSSIGRGAVSVGGAAAAFASEALGSVAGSSVLVLGAGEVGEAVVRALHKAGARVTVASRSGATARVVAERWGGEEAPLEGLAPRLAAADVLVCASSAKRRLITLPLLRGALEGRSRPLVVLDLAVPRDVDPEAADLPGVSYVDVDGLSRRVLAARDRRRGVVEAAEAILEAEIASWAVWRRTATAAPTMAGITAYADEVRARELERALRGLDLDPAVHRRMEALSRSLVSKLLLHPITYLRSNPQDAAAAELLERVFRDSSAAPTAAAPPE